MKTKGERKPRFEVNANGLMIPPFLRTGRTGREQAGGKEAKEGQITSSVLRCPEEEVGYIGLKIKEEISARNINLRVLLE